MYSNCCCSCLFELEIIKISQSSHKMYSNNILNFQESMAILNACTKKSGNLLNAPRIYQWTGLNLQSPEDFTLKHFNQTPKYKSKTWCPLKVRLGKHQKAVCQTEIKNPANYDQQPCKNKQFL